MSMVSTSERSLTVIDVDRGQDDGFGESDRWRREAVRWVRAIVFGLLNEVIRCFFPGLPPSRGGRSGGVAPIPLHEIFWEACQSRFFEKRFSAISPPAALSCLCLSPLSLWG